MASLTPEDRVTLPGYNGKKTMYEGTEYTMMQKPFGEHASHNPPSISSPISSSQIFPIQIHTDSSISYRFINRLADFGEQKGHNATSI